MSDIPYDSSYLGAVNQGGRFVVRSRSGAPQIATQSDIFYDSRSCHVSRPLTMQSSQIYLKLLLGLRMLSS